MIDSTAKHHYASTTLAKPNAQLWDHMSASLDAASYIIALGLVDLITFGRPVHAEQQKQQQQQREENSIATTRHNTDAFVSPPSSPVLGKESPVSKRFQGPAYAAPRRSASDPGNGASSSSSSSAERRTSWQRRSGSTDTYAESINDHFRRRNIHQHNARRLSQSHDGTVQHYQRKIFSRQVQRTMRLQPYVRVSIVFSFLLSFLFSTYLFVSIFTHGGVRPAVRALYRPFV